MKLDHPVFVIVMEGNTKPNVAACPYTKVASFNVIPNETTVFIEVEKLTRQERRELEKEVHKEYSKFGKIKDISYYQDGAEIIEMISNN